MNEILASAGNNLLSPIILSFVLGFFAAIVRSDLTIPEAMAKGLSLYLLFAIGFKGGVSVSTNEFDIGVLMALIVGSLLSLLLPLLAFALLKVLTRLDNLNAAAVAGHYGSISIVTFVAATSALELYGIDAEGYMVAVAAAMEAPAIVTALWLASRGDADGTSRMNAGMMREILLNGSIVLLIGAFIIGLLTGAEGMKEVESFIVTPFKGVLCLFLLDIGLVAGRSLLQSYKLITRGLVAFGVLMPVIGSIIGLALALLLNLSEGGAVLLMVLSASASYIAVPAAMRVALPEANAGIYLTLSLGITFPFNLTLGIPLYLAASSAIYS
ncbi:MAG: sodium-dependent bicarbonate transport family permease [Granulosicoccus sp.]